MKSLRLNLFFLALFVLASCAGPVEQTAVNTSFVFTSGLSALESQTGGIILYGKNKADPNNAFVMVMGTGVQQIELNNGTWEFMAVSWSGYNSNLGTYGNKMEGEVRCSLIPEKVLAGGDAELSFVLNQQTCSDSRFGLAETKNGTVPKYTKFYSCTNTDAFDDDNRDSLRCFNSIGGSFRMVLQSKNASGVLSDTMASRCIVNNHASQTTGVLDSINAHQLQLPIFFPTSPGPQWSYRVFSDSACGNRVSKADFNHPYANEISGDLARFTSDDEEADNIFMIYTPVCGTLPGEGANPFISHLETTDDNNNPVTESYRMICNKNQMINFMTSNSSLDYKLGRDLDFGGDLITEDVVGGTFSGKFFGDNRKISNFTLTATGSSNIGLFSNVNGGTIQDLKLENISIDCTDSSNVGALAGQFVNGSFFNISASTINVTSDGCYSLGGLIGNVDYQGEQTRKIKVANVAIFMDADGTIDLGGVFGNYDNSYLLDSEFNDIQIWQTTAASSGMTSLGGVVGNADSSKFKNIRAENIRIGESLEPFANFMNIGLFAGTGSNLDSLKNIYTQGMINVDSTSQNIGGVIGDASSLAVTSEFSNLVANVDIYSGGANTGGIFGNGSNIYNGKVFRAFGQISCVSTCGGVIGTSQFNTLSMMYSNVDLQASMNTSINDVGGVIGKSSSDNTLDMLQNDGDLNFPSANSTTNSIGGVIGKILNNPTFGLRYLINHGDVTGNNIVGGLVGQVDDDATGIINSINSGNIVATGAFKDGIMGDFIDGNTASLYDGTIAGVFNVNSNPVNSYINSNVMSVSLSALYDLATFVGSGLNSSAVEGDGASVVDLKPIHRLIALGGGQSIGNFADPFVINTPAQWNLIEDNEFFMNGTFKLGANLDFSGVTFKPIGSDVEAFQGTFLGEDHSIENVTIVGENVTVLSGLVSLTGGLNSVNGSGTSFTTELSPGDMISIAGYKYKVDLIQSDTLLILKTGALGSDSSVSISRVPSNYFGLFASIENATFNSPKSEGEDYDKKLYIRNISITIPETQGETHVGGLIGDAYKNNSLRSIVMDNIDINVTASGADGAYIGGLIGYYELYSDNSSYWSYIDVTNSNISGTGGDWTYAGGILGKVYATEETAATYPYHNFEGFRVMDTVISAMGVGGVGYSAYAGSGVSMEFENILVSGGSNSNFTASAHDAGGIFAVTNDVELRNFAVTSQISVASNSSNYAGGIVANPAGGKIQNGYSRANVYSDSGQAGCLTGPIGQPLVSGTNLQIENIFGYCATVLTGSGTASYSIIDDWYVDLTGNDVFYVGGSDDGFSGTRQITVSELSNQAYMNATYPSFEGGDPWLWPEGGGLPLTVMEFYPEYFFQ